MSFGWFDQLHSRRGFSSGLLAMGLWGPFADANDIVPAARSGDVNSEEIPSIYVRAVTGPLAGKSVCYVCRNGDRPVVVVVLRDLGADVASLLKELDRTVNLHRAEGLRCFAMLLTEQPQQDAARLQTLAFDGKIEVPLTLVSENALQGSQLAMPRDCMISVIAYRDRRVVERFEYRAEGCDKSARATIVAAAEKLVRNDK